MWSRVEQGSPSHCLRRGAHTSPPAALGQEKGLEGRGLSVSPGTRRIPALQRVTLWLCFSGVLLSLPQEFGGSNQGLHVGFWLQKLTVQLPHPLSRISGGRRGKEEDSGNVLASWEGGDPGCCTGLGAQRLGVIQAPEEQMAKPSAQS